MTMAQNKQKWSLTDKQQLIDICKEYRDKNNKVLWDQVQECFPNRTKQQLKSQYTNNLKTDQTYHKWSYLEKILLSACVLNYGQDWPLIQKTYFSTLDKEQLRARFQMQMKIRQYRREMVDAVLTDVYHFERYSITIIEKSIKFYIVIKNRIKVLLGHYIPPSEYTEIDKQFGLIQNDPIELKLIEVVYKKFTLEQITEIIERLNKLKQKSIEYLQQCEEKGIKPQHVA